VLVSIAIQAHPDRAYLAEPLAAETGAEIVYDPEPDAQWRSPWRTYRHALLTAPPEVTHRLILQDDALVCPNFAVAARAAIAARPDAVIAFYVGGAPYHQAEAVREACKRDDAWAVLENAHWLPAVAVSWPRPHIEEIVPWVDSQGWPEKFRADDEILGRYLREHRLRALATVPSLVDHPDVEPSLVGTRTRGGDDPARVAACYIGDCAGCALEIDWSRGPG
jgi:hypothetical protein